MRLLYWRYYSTLKLYIFFYIDGSSHIESRWQKLSKPSLSILHWTLRPSSLHKYPLPKPSLTLEQRKTTWFLALSTNDLLDNQKRETTLYIQHITQVFERSIRTVTLYSERIGAALTFIGLHSQVYAEIALRYEYIPRVPFTNLSFRLQGDTLIFPRLTPLLVFC